MNKDSRNANVLLFINEDEILNVTKQEFKTS